MTMNSLIDELKWRIGVILRFQAKLKMYDRKIKYLRNNYTIKGAECLNQNLCREIPVFKFQAWQLLRRSRELQLISMYANLS